MAERYQREIEEILEEAGERPPARPPKRARPPRRRPARRERGYSLVPTPGRIAFAGAAAIAAALALNLLDAPGATIFLWAGVALLVAAYAAYFMKPRRTVERRWRGQLMDAPPEPGPLSRLWRRITGG